jgi:hypothetical protein
MDISRSHLINTTQDFRLTSHLFSMRSIAELLLTLACLLTTDAAIADDLEAGVRYAAGTRLRDPATGISLVVPADWGAVLPSGARTMTLDSPVQPGLGLIAWRTDVDVEDLLAELAEPQVLDEAYVLQLQEAPKREDNRVTARYQSGENCGLLMAVIGPDSRAVLMLLTGPMDRAAYYTTLLEQLRLSIRFNEPPGPPHQDTPT